MLFHSRKGDITEAHLWSSVCVSKTVIHFTDPMGLLNILVVDNQLPWILSNRELSSHSQYSVLCGCRPFHTGTVLQCDHFCCYMYLFETLHDINKMKIFLVGWGWGGVGWGLRRSPRFGDGVAVVVCGVEGGDPAPVYLLFGLVPDTDLDRRGYFGV